MFTGKARAYPREASLPEGWFLAVPTNNRLAWKRGANTGLLQACVNYGRNLRIFISSSVCTWQAFEPSLMFAGKARAYPNSRVGYWLYPQTLY
jgi:hypothetical protein